MLGKKDDYDPESDQSLDDIRPGEPPSLNPASCSTEKNTEEMEDWVLIEPEQTVWLQPRPRLMGLCDRESSRPEDTRAGKRPSYSRDMAATVGVELESYSDHLWRAVEPSVRREVRDVVNRLKQNPSSSTLVNSTVFTDSRGKELIDNWWPAIEPRVRQVVQEELGRASASLPRLSPQKAIPNTMVDSSSLQLIFRNSLSLPIFTMTKIEDIYGNPPQILLIDGSTKSKVQHPSPIKVELHVLDGTFSEGRDYWTTDEFNDGILTQRSGKRPLLIGDIQVTLKDGLSSIDELNFTDNSSWIKCQHFRIGARVSPGDSYNGPTIKEAVTEALRVKDHRGKSYKKHYPPSLSDDVWRLDGIHKDGAFHRNLEAKGLNKVQDFLKQWFVYADDLRSILGNGMSDRMWKEIIKHAQTCNIGEKQYIYTNSNGTIILNAVCHVWVIFLDGAMYTQDQLSPQQLITARGLLCEAHEKWHEVKEADAELLTYINTRLLQNTALLQGTAPELQFANL